MKEEFKAAENIELVDPGKDLEAQYYQPQIETEAREREAAQALGLTHGAGRSRVGASDP